MNPYYLFPAELWEMINNHMKSPEDKLKLMRAHPNLYNQFGGKEKENELLFASALPFILTHLESSGRQMNNEERKVLREVFLACRLVSSSSCKVVDKWLESYWKKSTGDHQPPSFLQHARDEEFGHDESIINLSRSVLDKFTQDFQNDPCETRNPLLSRFVSLPILIWGTEEKQAQELEDDKKRVAVFKKIGPHLRKLQVDFVVDYTVNQGVWLAKLSSLRNVLELTSNIRSLVLIFPAHGNPRLRNNQISLPALPHLDHLKVTGGWKTSQKDILASIRVYLPRLKELEFEDVIDFPEDYLGDADLFTELKSLKLITFSRSSGFTETMKKLNKILLNITAQNLALIEFRFNLFLSFLTTWPDHKLGKVRKSALRSLNKNPAYSRPEPELPWELTTIQGVGHSQNITLIFSRRLN